MPQYYDVSVFRKPTGDRPGATYEYVTDMDGLKKRFGTSVIDIVDCHDFEFIRYTRGGAAVSIMVNTQAVRHTCETAPVMHGIVEHIGGSYNAYYNTYLRLNCLNAECPDRLCPWRRYRDEAVKARAAVWDEGNPDE